MQGVLALLAFASLVVKRQRERPQRPVLVWGLDVSKQVVSMLAAHTCGECNQQGRGVEAGSSSSRGNTAA